MIESISISNIATYGTTPEMLNGLRKFNFIYGSNGTGKTTSKNTLRRILENYFKIHGCMDFDSICEMFEGNEKIICRSLFSWVNDGSHYAHDDLYVSIDTLQIENYLRVFRDIFEKTKHTPHYEMMMGTALTGN